MFIKLNKHKFLLVLAIVSLAILVNSLSTYLAIEKFGKVEEVFFNRSMKVLALNFMVLALSVIIFYYKRGFGLAIACLSSFHAISSIYVLGGQMNLIQGWFTCIPVTGLLIMLIERCKDKRIA